MDEEQLYHNKTQKGATTENRFNRRQFRLYHNKTQKGATTAERFGGGDFDYTTTRLKRELQP